MLDQSVLFGVPDLHDRHRDMRLDVDNMSYEVILLLQYSVLCIDRFFYECSVWKISGIAGVGRTHRECKHWIDRGNHFEVPEAEEVCFYCSSSRRRRRCRAMLYMPSMPSPMTRVVNLLPVPDYVF